MCRNKFKPFVNLWLYLFCFLTVFVSVWATNAMSQSSASSTFQPARTGFTLHYTVDLTAPSKNTVRVILVIETQGIRDLSLSSGTIHHFIHEGDPWSPQELSFDAEPATGFSVRISESARPVNPLAPPSFHPQPCTIDCGHISPPLQVFRGRPAINSRALNPCVSAAFTPPSLAQAGKWPDPDRVVRCGAPTRWLPQGAFLPLLQPSDGPFSLGFGRKAIPHDGKHIFGGSGQSRWRLHYKPT